jgi:hypothetical protein
VRATYTRGFFQSPPCVCGCDVSEVTHGLAAAAGKSSHRYVEASSRALADNVEAVRIQGTYSGGAEAFLRVQRWERGM